MERDEYHQQKIKEHRKETGCICVGTRPEQSFDAVVHICVTCGKSVWVIFLD